MLNLEQSSGIVGFFMVFLKNTCMLINRNLVLERGKYKLRIRSIFNEKLQKNWVLRALFYQYLF
ncbi:MAG TPA: hypothetical protein DCP10_09075 [Bacteroidales bacterium]|nr:hypothetical protein [Bacteroidales bacterium]